MKGRAEMVRLQRTPAFQRAMRRAPRWKPLPMVLQARRANKPLVMRWALVRAHLLRRFGTLRHPEI